MSTIARSVYDAIKSKVETTLGAEWSELRYVFDIVQNDGRGIVKGFGVVPEDAPPANSIIKAMTFDHTFQIVLTQTNVREQDDADAIAAVLDELYNKADDVLHDVLNQQLGIPHIIMTVTNGGISAPEILESYIVLRFRVIVRYRRTIP